MTDLSRRQSEVLRFIRVFTRSEGYPPTRQEIADHFGFASPNAAAEHVKALAKKGAIRIAPHKSRGIVVV